jgi:DNA-binding NarL/FixJ family response regulator
MTIRLAIVDDHTLFRSALARLFELQADLEVVAEAGDAAGAMRLAATERPDVLLLDVDIPGPSPVETVRAITTSTPEVAVLMLSMVDDPGVIRSLLAAGARGYLLKSCSDDELHAAIRSVVDEPRKVVLSVTAGLFEARPEEPVAVLTAREHQILLLASRALSNRQIANRLGVKEATVKRHLHNAYVKLEATSRIDAVNKAVGLGIIESARAGAGNGARG